MIASGLPFVRVARPIRFPTGAGAGQRGAERRDLVAEAAVWDLDIEGDEPLPLTLSEVSATGAFIASALLLPIGHRVGIQFTLPDQGHVIEAEGHIVRIQHRTGRAGMGLTFERMSADDRAILRAYTAWH